MKIVATATVEQGVKTNRVKRVRKAASAGTATARYKQDPNVRGMDTAVTCISMPTVELVQLDAMCERVNMARSHFIRQAVKHFAEKLFNGNQERIWREALK